MVLSFEMLFPRRSLQIHKTWPYWKHRMASERRDFVAEVSQEVENK
jgi:hypothetical protein